MAKNEVRQRKKDSKNEEKDDNTEKMKEEKTITSTPRLDFEKLFKRYFISSLLMDGKNRKFSV